MGISNFEGFTGFGGSIIEGIEGSATPTETNVPDNFLQRSELLNNNKIKDEYLPATFNVAEVNQAKDAAKTQAASARAAATSVNTAKNAANSAAKTATEVADTVSSRLYNDSTAYQEYINKKKVKYQEIIDALNEELETAKFTVSEIDNLKVTGEGYVGEILAKKTQANNLVADIATLKENAIKHLSDISGEHDTVIQHRKDISGLHDICIEHEKQIRIIREKMEIILNETNGAGETVVSSATGDGANRGEKWGVGGPGGFNGFANIQEGFKEGMDNTQFLAGAYRKHENNISKQAQERSLNRMGEFLQQTDDIAGQHFMDYLIHEKRGTVDDVFQRQKQDNILKERLVQTKEYQMRIYDQYIKIGKVAVIAFALCVFFMFLNSKEFIGNSSKFVSIFLIVIITIIYVIREIIWLSLRDPINFDKTNQGHDRQYEHDISNNKYSGKDYDLGILSGTCVGSSCCEAGQIYNSAKNKCISSSTPQEIAYNINVFDNYELNGNDRKGPVSGIDPTVTLNVGDTINFYLKFSQSSTETFNIKNDNQVNLQDVTGQGNKTGTVSWTPSVSGTYYYNSNSNSGKIIVE